MERCKGTIFCVLLLILVAGGESSTPQKKGNCTYAITIETTCVKGAETSNHVNLRFGDKNSNDIIIHHLNTKHLTILDPLQPNGYGALNYDNYYDYIIPKKPFQACNVDQFQVTTECVESPICYLYLKLNGNDDWRPGFAQVRVLEEDKLSSNYFYFRRYLPRNVWHGFDFCNDKELTPFGVKQKRKAFVTKLIN